MKLSEIPRGPSLKPPLMRAALEGAKTETRRVIPTVGEADVWLEPIKDELYCYIHDEGRDQDDEIPATYQPGLHSLREPLWAQPDPSVPELEGPDSVRAHYRTDNEPVWLPTECWDWPGVDGPQTMPWRQKGRPDNDPYEVDELLGIFMPKVAARAFVELEVRVERLHEMDVSDALSEGIVYHTDEPGYGTWCGDTLFGDPMEAFRALWNSINPEYPWQSNPWVFVYSWSEVLTRDQVEAM